MLKIHQYALVLFWRIYIVGQSELLIDQIPPKELFNFYASVN